MRYQSLNEYRKRFMLKPFKSFEELTGNSFDPTFLNTAHNVVTRLEQDGLAVKIGFFRLWFLIFNNCRRKRNGS